MAEQQIVDYIKKARDAGQSDDQSKSLLLKNGWTDAEISDAVISLGQPTAQPEPEPQAEPQPQAVVSQPEIEVQPEVVSQPQPQAQPQAQPVQFDMPRTKKSHLFIKLLMVLIIVVVLGGVGYFVAGQYISLPFSDILLNIFSPSPTTVINKMVVNMQSVKSSHMVAQETANVTNNNVSTGKLSVGITGDSDVTTANNPKLNSIISINLTSSLSATANIGLTAVDGATYFEINNLTVPDGYSVPGLDVSKLTGVWFKVDGDSIKALSQADASQVGVVNISNLDNLALVKKIQDLFISENLLSNAKKINDEVVNGQNTYHYLITINKDKLKDLITKIITLETAGSSGSLTQNMVSTVAGNFVDGVGDINLELWIGKTDYFLYQAKIDKIIDLAKFGLGANTQMELIFSLANSNFNKPATIQAPANSQKIEGVLLPLLKTQRVGSDFGQIMVIAESVFNGNKSYYSLCSHGLFNGYLEDSGSQLINLNNDVVAQGGTKPT